MKAITRYHGLGLVLLLVVVLWSVSPQLQQTPARDSGFYLYAGARLLQGDRLYVDVWDHKPPLIHLINALGLALGHGLAWGVWFLEVLASGAAVWLAYVFLSAFYGERAAALSVVASLGLLVQILQGGNYTEEFAILFQVASVYFFVRYQQSRVCSDALACGVSLGMLFFLRQNLIAVGVAIVLFYIWKLLIERQGEVVDGVRIAAGFALVAALVGVYILWFSDIEAFWQAAFGYNFGYTRLGLLGRVNALRRGLIFMARSPLWIVMGLAWLLAAACLFRHQAHAVQRFVAERRVGWLLLGVAVGLAAFVAWMELRPGAVPGIGLGQKLVLAAGGVLLLGAWLSLSGMLRRSAERAGAPRQSWQPEQADLALLLVIWFPVEFYMATLSGRLYLHYFIQLVVPGMFLFAFLFHELTRFLRARWRGWRAGVMGIWALWLALGVVAFPLVPLDDLYVRRADAQTLVMTAWLQEISGADDGAVLIWGAEPAIYYLARRRSPTPYAYLYPLIATNAAGQGHVEKFMTALEDSSPRWIVDTLDADFPRIEGACDVDASAAFPDTEEVFRYICAHYHYEAQVGPESWPVFQFHP